MMHIDKNVCASLIGTLLNIPNKTKDRVKTRLNLVEIDMRIELAPRAGGKRMYLPPTCKFSKKRRKTTSFVTPQFIANTIRYETIHFSSYKNLGNKNKNLIENNI